MVISYTIDELNAIGRKVILQECLSRVQQNQQQTNGSNNFNNNNFQLELLQFQQQLQKHLGHPITVNSRSEDNSKHEQQQQNHIYHNQQQQQLTSSVAEFFRKAQQNFLCEASLDATKVKLLSEVEAELIGDRQDLS